MPLDKTLRVHIAPQGYEQDRIYKPAIEYEADIVYLLTTDDDQSEECKEVVQSKLEEANIEHEDVSCNIFDSTESVQVMSEIIKTHSGDDVQVNVSTGSKITAISGMFACMMYGATPYYVKAEDYGEETVSVGVEKTVQLPAYPIDPPEEALVKVLGFLDDHANEEDESVIIDDINGFMLDNDLKPVKKSNRDESDQIYDMTTDYLESIETKGHIRILHIAGQKEVTLTDQGKQTLEFSRHLLEDQ